MCAMVKMYSIDLFPEVAQSVGDNDETDPVPDHQSKVSTARQSVVESEHQEAAPQLALSPLLSQGAVWAEEIMLDWEEIVVRDNLLGLRDFFKEGICIRLKEEKV